MKKKFRINVLIFIFFPTFLSFASSSMAQIDLPKNAQGWTIFTPSSDSRIMYISKSGNDGTGQIYSSTSFADPFNPSGEKAFATYAAAFAKARDGYPDWILFKRGETFTETIGKNVISGRSATEPFLVGAYGSSGASPVIQVSGGAISISDDSYIVISGLDFYAYTCDPKNGSYYSDHGTNGIFCYAGDSDDVIDSVLFEGCKVRFFQNGFNLQEKDGGTITGLELYRCIVLDNFPNSDGHSQGLFAYGYDVVVEECIFDHNGWYSEFGSGKVGEATMFNHNIYISNSESTTIKNCILTRSSSIGIKDKAYKTSPTKHILIDNNLFLEDEIGISIGEQDDHYTFNHQDVTITNNVLTNLGLNAPRNTNFAWYIEVHGTDTGLISNNLLINQEDLSNQNNFGISLKGAVADIIIIDNIVYNLHYTTPLVFDDEYGSSSTTKGVQLKDNIFQTPIYGWASVRAEYDITETNTEISGNQYYSDRAEGTRFYLDTTLLTDLDWATATGDDSSFVEVSFPDNKRDVDTYLDHIYSTPGSTLGDFIIAVRAQDRYNWDFRLEADAVNSWIRAGFFENPAGTKQTLEVTPPENLKILEN